MNINLKLGKITTLKKYDNGTAVCRGLIIYSQDASVMDTEGNKVLLNKKFLDGIVTRYNKDHKGLFGLGKKYPKFIDEHNYTADNVLGRLTSRLELSKMDIEGELRDSVLADILISDPETIAEIEGGRRGISAGIYFDKKGAYLKEVTLTDEPALDHAVLLNEEGQKVILSDSSEVISDIIKIEKRIEAFEEGCALQLSKAMQDIEEKEKLDKVNKVLLSQVHKNKLLRVDAKELLPICKDIPPAVLTKVFSKCSPLKLNRRVDLNSLQILTKPNEEV